MGRWRVPPSGQPADQHHAQSHEPETHAQPHDPRHTDVAATRARDANHLYVAIDDTHDVESAHGAGDYPTARDVLLAVLTNTGGPLSR